MDSDGEEGPSRHVVNLGGRMGAPRDRLAEWARFMILLYLNHDIAFPSPTLAKAGDGAAHGA